MPATRLGGPEYRQTTPASMCEIVYVCDGSADNTDAHCNWGYDSAWALLGYLVSLSSLHTCLASAEDRKKFLIHQLTAWLLSALETGPDTGVESRSTVSNLFHGRRKNDVFPPPLLPLVTQLHTGSAADDGFPVMIPEENWRSHQRCGCPVGSPRNLWGAAGYFRQDLSETFFSEMFGKWRIRKCPTTQTTPEALFNFFSCKFFSHCSKLNPVSDDLTILCWSHV